MAQPTKMLRVGEHGDGKSTRVNGSHDHQLSMEPLCGRRQLPRTGGMMPPIRVVVLGQAGDGKSTLIDSLRDKSKSEPPKRGRNPNGVTKSVLRYPGLPINGRDVVYFDTPGIGDLDVKVTDVLKMLEDTLQQEGQVDGIIVTHKLTDCRLRLGAQFVQTIVQHGFVAGDNPWAHVILVGTHRDRAEAEDVDNFRTALARLFFKSGVGEGAAVVGDWYDYGQVVRAISMLPLIGAVQWRGAATASITKQLVQDMCDAEVQQLRFKMHDNEERLRNLRADFSSMECVRQAEISRSDALTHIYQVVRHATRCPFEHGLQPFSVPSGHLLSCDVCDDFLVPGTDLRTCRDCDFDVCQKCMGKRIGHAGCMLPFEYQPTWFVDAVETMERISSVMKGVEDLVGEYLEIIDCHGNWLDPRQIGPDVPPSLFPLSFFIDTGPCSSGAASSSWLYA